MAFDYAFNGVSTMLDKTGKAGAAFEDEMKPLLSLGGNLKSGGALKDKVLGLSGAYGIDRGQVSSSMFYLQSAAANMTGGQREQILSAAGGVNKVAGGDLQTDVLAVTKLMQTYGASMGTADMAASKLMVTEDQAAITMQELATLLPDVLPAAKLMGHTYDEVAASIITATQVMGNNEKTMTGLRNMFLKLAEAQEKGLVHAGKLTDQLAELSRLPGGVLEKMFGEREVAVVAALADKTGEVLHNVQNMEKVTGSEVFSKFLDRMAGDKSRGGARDAETSKGVEQDLANVDVLRAEDATLRDKDLRLKMTKLGYKQTVNPFMDSVSPEWFQNLRVAFSGMRDDTSNDYLQIGVGQRLADLYKARDKQSVLQADLLKLQYGGATGTRVDDAPYQKDRATGKITRAGPRETDAGDAQRYAEFRQHLKGGGGLKDFLQYEGLQGSNPAAARQFISALEKVSAAMQQSAAQHAQAAERQQQAAQQQEQAAKGARNRNAHN